MNTSKSLNQILIDFLKEDDDGNVNLAKAKADIVEAVEGIYGDSDGLREFAGLNLIKPVPKVPSKRKEQ